MNPEKEKFNMGGEDEEKDDPMGTKRVARDLARKYGLPDNDESKGSGTVPGDRGAEDSALDDDPRGIKRVLVELKSRKEEQTRRLEGLPKERFRIPESDLEGLFECAQMIEDFMEEYDKYLVNNPDCDKEEFSRMKLRELISRLDQHDVWRHKFSTECSGGATDSIPLQSYNSAEDSMYFMTESGSSLRLKVIELKSGLRKVAQPILEKCVFSHGEVFKEIPEIGGRVYEFSSRAFEEAVEKGETTYEPGLDVYKENADIVYVGGSEPHYGDRVNKIFK